MANSIHTKSFLKQVLTLASGTVMGQVLLFISLPFLQRFFYGPEEFGVFTVFVSISEMLINISGLKYEYGIVLQKRHKNAVNLLLLSVFSVTITAISTLLIYFLMFFFWPQISWVKDLGMLGFLLPVSVFCFGCVNAFNYWFNREQMYGRMSVTKGISSVASEPIKFAGAGLPLNGLVLGRVGGQIAAFVYVLFQFFRKFNSFKKLFSSKQIKKEARFNKRYPFFVMPGAFITVLITAVYVQFFSHYFGKEQVGLLGVSVSYLGVAFGVISTAFGQVFFKKISDIQDVSVLKSLFLKFAGYLALIAVMVIFAVYIFPEKWVVNMLGERWKDILPVTRIMVLWISVSFVSTSLSFIHIRIGNQLGILIIELIHLLGVVLALFGCYFYTRSFETTLYAFTTVQIVHYLAVIVSAFYLLNRKLTL